MGISQNFNSILKAINSVEKTPATIIAVSKRIPVEKISELNSETGHRFFGENQVQELRRKALKLPKTINWHFIGHLQSNKCRDLVKIHNLVVVETVGSFKIADKLENECKKIDRKCLNVFVQVNTSREEEKSGIEIEKCLELVLHINKSCERLKFIGLMTIGRKGDIDCFKELVKLRDLISVKCSKEKEEISLSMGMSSDYIEAIKYGATNVRIGTAIFGQRN